MSNTKLRFAIALLGCVVSMPMAKAQAQDDDRRSVTLGDRIEQFRSDFTGERIPRQTRSNYPQRPSRPANSNYRDDYDNSDMRGDSARPYNPELYRDYRTEEYQKNLKASRARRAQEQQRAEQMAREADLEAQQYEAQRARRMEMRERQNFSIREDDPRRMQAEFGQEPIPQPTPPRATRGAIDGRGSVVDDAPKAATPHVAQQRQILSPKTSPLPTRQETVEVEEEFVPPDVTPSTAKPAVRSTGPVVVAKPAKPKIAEPKELPAKEPAAAEIADSKDAKKPHAAAQVASGLSSRRTASGETTRTHRVRATEQGTPEPTLDEEMSSKIAKHTAQPPKPTKTLLSPEPKSVASSGKSLTPDHAEPNVSAEPLNVSEKEQGEPTPALAAAPPAQEIAPPSKLGQRCEVTDLTPARPAAPEVTSLLSSKGPTLALEAIGPRKIVIGKEENYEINLRNQGDAVSNIVVYIQIPSSVEITSYQGDVGSVHPPVGVGSGEPYEWIVPRIEANSKQTLSLKVVPRKGTPFELGMRYVVNQELQQTIVEVQEPKLVMNLAGPADVMYGESKIYKLAINNPGTGDAENVVVALTPLGRGAEATASHRVGTLRPGESRMIEVELTAREAGELVIKAQASADGGLRADTMEQVTVRRAALALDVKSPKELYAQTAATYSVEITNQGNATAEHVQISAQLPPDAEFRTASAGGALAPDHSAVIWNLGSLPAGATKEFTMKCVLQSPGTNPLQVTANADTDLATLAQAHTNVIAVADLKLEVRDPQGPIAVGDDAVYEVVLKNRGSKAAEQVLVRAFFSEGLEASSVQGALAEIHAGKGEVIFETIPKIEAGSEAVFRIHTTADRAGNHVFHAQVTCDNVSARLAAEQTTLFYADSSSAAGRDQTEQANASGDASKNTDGEFARQGRDR